MSVTYRDLLARTKAEIKEVDALTADALIAGGARPIGYSAAPTRRGGSSCGA